MPRRPLHRSSKVTAKIMAGDLRSMAAWFSCAPEELHLRIETMPLSCFRPQIEAGLQRDRQQPAERRRTQAILRRLKAAERALPLFVDAADAQHVVIAGRHRMLALHQLGRVTATVVLVNRIAATPVATTRSLAPAQQLQQLQPQQS